MFAARLAVVLALAAPGRAMAEPAPPTLDAVLRAEAGLPPRAPGDREADGDADRPAASPTSTVLGRRALDRRPGQRTTDLLRHVPGLTALGQGGQADQLLLRGFDAGQGAAVGVEVDGVPINLSSHAYAHGYADTHFLIPDAVREVALYEGAYAARHGALAPAGTLAIRTLDEVPGGALVRLTSGRELSSQLIKGSLRRLRYRLVGMVSPELDDGAALLAAEVGIDDGPYVHPQRFRRGVVLAKLRRAVGGGELRTALQFYMGRWFDPGHLPAAAIEAERLTPWSSADPTQGGSAVRSSASVAYDVTDRRGATWHVGTYLVDSDLRLYTNPTLFLRDTDAGDEIEYVDGRVYYGLDAYYRRRHRWAWLPGVLRVGVQARADHAEATTWHDERRLRLVGCDAVAANPCTDTAPATRNVAVYAEDTTDLGPLRAQAGLRLDQDTWNVDDRDADTQLGRTTLGGTGARARLSPKLLTTWRGEAVDLVVAGAAGSFATDARASVDRSGYGAFVRTWSGEVGARFHPSAELRAAVAGWWTQVNKHQVWIASEARGYRADLARRRGVSATLMFTPAAWLTLDAALTVARGNTRPDRDAPGVLLPLAPRLSGNGGLAVHRGDDLASVRVRALGPRTTTDPDRPARGHLLIDLVARHRWRDLEFTLTVDNVLDERWRESQVAGQVRSSRSVEPTADLLVTTGVPLTAMLTLGYAPR